MPGFEDIESRARNLADYFEVDVAGHPLDTLRIMGHGPDVPLSHDDHIRMDLIVGAAVDVFYHFVGPNRILDRPVTVKEIDELVWSDEWGEHMIWGREDQVVSIAYRYLMGKGDDYEQFLNFG
jgi:hypothetical protein